MTFTLTAVKQHSKADDLWKDCYCYDDQYVTAEPLVHQTTETIHRLFEFHKTDPPQAVKINFGEKLENLGLENWDNSSILVHMCILNQDDQGTTYSVSPLYPEETEEAWMESSFYDDRPIHAWLCNHLCDYFDTPPQYFFAKITPTDDKR